MSEEKAVSRRQFLKIAGVAGASIGVAGGLGGLVAACGSNGTTTTTGPATTAGATTTTAGAATTTTAAAATTTVSAAAEAGREIKVGVVVPKTGPLAAFAGPILEVHISNIHKREAFRRHSYVSTVAAGVIAGCGTQGYALALQRVASLLDAKAP